ncbi:formate/nitrite transporter family protein [Geofilum rubicundum]|uniref:Formate efflux transporter n=1 Tax=Geofilum rubicundum JCM 15548 TaxID=1236989 RepID=A0A0E9LW87_9BACT|nr:formate/nitrite transporter family protein [Geofilum rubicundum]GAO29371.1 formate efflux transporter [Geofilum rubicundum JCM 15548]
MAYFTPGELVAKATDAALLRSHTSVRNTLILAFLAGAYIALGGLLAVMVGGGMPGVAAENPGLQKWVMGAVFPLGLILCVIGGADLFTGNTAYFVPPLLSRRMPLSALLKNWSLVYAGNFVGSLFVAYLLAFQTGLLAASPWLESVTGIAEAKTSASFFTVFAKGIGANWLVALAVWLAFAAQDVSGKILAIWFPVMAFVAMGFEHSVANMFFIPVAIFYGADVTWGSFLLDNLLPATLGNIVGGSLLTGLLYGLVYGKG